MKTCCAGWFLLLVCNVMAMEWRTYEGLSDENVAYLRERFKTPENLKESLMGNFTSEHFLWPHETLLFKQKFGVADDILRAALLEIIHESVKVAEWKPCSIEDPEELTFAKRRLMESIKWLGVCADDSAKEFLMEIAVDDTKGEVYRDEAVDAYIRSADAQQVKDALIRFLVKERVLIDSTYFYATEAYDAAEDDPQKRAAIVSALTAAALEKEEDRGYFAKADEHFAGQDKGYAQSPQRKKALDRMNMSSGKQGAGSRLWLYAGVFLCALCATLCLMAKKRGTRQ